MFVYFEKDENFKLFFMYLLKKYHYPPIIFFKNQAICFEDLQINMFFDLSEIYSTHFLFISVFDCCFLRCRFFHSFSFDFPVKGIMCIQILQKIVQIYKKKSFYQSSCLIGVTLNFP